MITTVALDYSGTIAEPASSITSDHVRPLLKRLGVRHRRFDQLVETFLQSLRTHDAASHRVGRELRLDSFVWSWLRSTEDWAIDHDVVTQAVDDVLLLPRERPPTAGGASLVSELATAGYAVVVTSNTKATARVRQSTIESVGLASCCSHLFLSSELGWRKPHREFYGAVFGCLSTPPARVLFVGDRLRSDVLGARRAGARALGLPACRQTAEPAARYGSIRDIALRVERNLRSPQSGASTSTVRA